MKHQPSFSRASGLRAILAGFAVTMLAFPASAATSFPDYPLQTGVGSIPPNIMFILDNSGSMGLISMPTTDEAFDAEPVDYSGTSTGRTQVGLRDNPHDRSYLNNGVYYNPNIDYRPWLTADGVTRLSGGITVDAAYSNWNLADAASGTRDLRGSSESIFYMPKSGVTASTDPSDFVRYWVNASGKVVTGSPVRVSGFPKGPLDSSMPYDTQRTFSIAVSAGTGSLGISTSGGGRNVELNLVDPSGNRQCQSNGGNGGEACSVSNPRAGSWTVQVYRDNGDFSNVTLDAYSTLEIEGTPTGRLQAEELKNIATWYSYFRSRMKTAKAGASEAFAALSENNRVGYTPINGRSSDLSATGTNQVIPVGTNDGLFSGTNKTSWFDSIHRAQTAAGSTPLRGALNDVGRYYTRSDANGPWGPQSDEDQLSCRQNFAILTTDGYWNDSKDSRFGLGDEDGDGYSVTLADIAAHYYNSDLRDLTDNVPNSASDKASWQHMVTFGISIGLSGTLPQTDQPPASNSSIWPDPMDREDAERIDDLWHAAVNGHGNFIAAANAEDFARALKGALGNITKRRASGSNVTSNGPQLNAGSKIFQATFTSGDWSGDVESISIAGGDIAGSSSWSAAEVAKEEPANFLARGVYTWNSSILDGVAFPTSAQQAKLERTGGDAPVSGADNAAYIKGERSGEGGSLGDLRQRTTPIGDIVNSSPFYSEETAALFIGANDGMLHAINSADGHVEFSYVPAGLNFSALATLSDPEYQHKFFVDGGIDVTTRAQGNTKNILVGSLGRGGKGVFALDVTDPATFDETKVLWDHTFNGSTVVDSDMGYVLGAPLVRKGQNGMTLAFVGNGVDSDTGSAVLYVYNAETGAVVRKFPLGTAGGNGLAPPRAADTNVDGVADFLYAGDLKGNLWKFDIRNKDPSKWSFVKFFTAVGPDGVQPITAAVSIAREPVTERIFVMFGTGKYISSGDLESKTTQTLYALIDAGSAISGRSALHKRTIPFTGVDELGRAARSWEKYSTLPDDAKGWFVDLGIPTAGERVVTAPFMRGRALWFSSIIPQAGTGCDSGGTGYLNALDAFTGTNPKRNGGSGSYIDVDGDGEGTDKLTNAGEDGEDGFITSVDLGVGMVGQGTGVGGAIYACGSEAECGLVKTPPDGSGARRLGWRELYNRN
ncbi:pilus assembly protein [Luteimonas sp. 22616]|uniref:pilus assembly protein n=1 Tax=Luteimonas sp. 22616 TaxID=3453951 RepID=UPI003F86B1CC